MEPLHDPSTGDSPPPVDTLTEAVTNLMPDTHDRREWEAYFSFLDMTRTQLGDGSRGLSDRSEVGEYLGTVHAHLDYLTEEGHEGTRPPSPFVEELNEIWNNLEKQ